MCRFRASTLFVLALVLVACGESDTKGPADSAKEAPEVERIRKGIAGGIYIGWDDSVRALRARGEAAQLVPALLGFVREGGAMKSQAALDLVRLLGPQGRSIAGPLAEAARKPSKSGPSSGELVKAIAYVRPRADDLIAPATALLRDTNRDARAAGANLVSCIGPDGQSLAPTLLGLFDSEAGLRASIVRALASIGGPSIASELAQRAASSDDDVAKFALDALSLLGAEGVVGADAGLAALSRPKVRQAAAKYLKRHASIVARSVPALLDASSADVLDRRALYDALATLAPTDSGVRDKMIARVATSDGDAARWLAQGWPTDADAARAVASASAKATPDEERAFLEALGSFEGPAAEVDAALVERANRPSGQFYLRALLLEGLARRGIRGDVVTRLANQSLTAREAPLAAAAGALLVALGRDADADPVLATTLTDWAGQDFVWRSIVRTKRVGPKTLDALVAGIKSGALKEGACETIENARLGDPRLDTELASAAKSAYRDPPTRLAAAHALAVLRGEHELARRTALEILNESPIDSEYSRKPAIELLVADAGDAADIRAAIEACRRDPLPSVRDAVNGFPPESRRAK